MGKYSIQLHIYCSNTTAESVYSMGPAPYMATELFASLPPNCSTANLQIVKNIISRLEPRFIVKRMPFNFYFESHHRFPATPECNYN